MTAVSPDESEHKPLWKPSSLTSVWTSQRTRLPRSHRAQPVQRETGQKGCPPGPASDLPLLSLQRGSNSGESCSRASAESLLVNQRDGRAAVQRLPVRATDCRMGSNICRQEMLNYHNHTWFCFRCPGPGFVGVMQTCGASSGELQIRASPWIWRRNSPRGSTKLNPEEQPFDKQPQTSYNTHGQGFLNPRRGRSLVRAPTTTVSPGPGLGGTVRAGQAPSLPLQLPVSSYRPVWMGKEVQNARVSF